MSEVSGEETTDVTDKGTVTDDESTKTPETEDSKVTDKSEKDESSSEESKDDDKSKSDDDEGEKSEGAPEKYADLTIPETMEIPAELLDNVQEWGRSLNLTQEQLQGATDLHVQAMEKFIETQQEQWETVKDGWEKEILEDKFFHDENGKADAALATSKAAVLSIGGEALMEALDATGAGSNPAVVRAFFELGQRIQSGTVNVRGMSEGDEGKTGAKALYPSMKK